MDHLIHSSQDPNLQKLHGALNLQHLAHCLNHMLIRWEIDPGNDFWYDPENIDFEYEDFGAEWQTNLLNSIYWSLISGAVCFRAYNEPFFKAFKGGDESMFESCRYHPEPNSLQGNVNSLLTDAEVESLQQYPVYNLDGEIGTEDANLRDAKQQKVFRSFTNWILDGKGDEKASATRKRDQNVAISCDLSPVMSISQAKAPAGPVQEHLEGAATVGNQKSSPRASPKATVVRFGVFRVEEIVRPTLATDVISC